MYKKLHKRLLDIFLGTMLLLFFLLPGIIIALILFFEHRGKVFFTQKRTGYLGKEIIIIKFRTMVPERDKEGNLLPDFKRITKPGFFLRKSSLDEIPQLLNVLQGSLSLVGPRPLITEYLPLYSPEQSARHNVKPGLTGLAQINGRNTLTWEEKFSFDVYYSANLSFLLDMKILLLTIIKVIFVTKEEVSIPEKFAGTPRNDLQDLDISA
jgi:lipopolysaccharide/colanic/teichoic acid biosynthesis glycosyltransferase